MLILGLLTFLVDPIHGFETLSDPGCPIFVCDIQLGKFDTLEAKMLLLAQFIVFDETVIEQSS